ncbi:MAG TPA: hypothetical protein VGY97_00135 [Solirubrobacteraceae bacterium]|nr:hypothetical protein [Solirubrobacteraceae bacterium]
MTFAAVLPATAAASDVFFTNTGQTIPTTGATQTDQLTQDATPSTCGAPHTQTTTAGGSRHFRNYFTASGINESACVTAALTTACSGATAIYSATYSAYQAAHPGTNEIAVLGSQPPTDTSYSFTVPGGSSFTTVVHEVTPNNPCLNFGLTLSADRPFATGAVSFIEQGLADNVFPGQTIDVSQAGWGASPTIADQIMRCDGSGLNCNPIIGATTSYTVTPGDIGSTFEVVETATDVSGTSTSTSSTTAPVIAVPPAPPYKASTTIGSIAPGATDIGVHADDATQAFTFPFSVTFYGQPYTMANASSNGNIQFLSSNTSFADNCLPDTGIGGPGIEGLQLDLRTDNFMHTGEGVFTAVSGPTGSRVFNAEFIGERFSGNQPVHFEYRFYENSPMISIIYGDVFDMGMSATAGLQQAPGGLPGAGFTQFSCNTGSLTNNLEVDYVPALPTISGTVGIAQPLTVTDPAFAGTGPITLSHAWLLCNTAGNSCSAIPGATGTTYTPTTANAGHTLRVATTGTNVAGSSTPFTSLATSVVPAPPPPNNPNPGNNQPAPAVVGVTGTPTSNGKEIDETVSCSGAGVCTGDLKGTTSAHRSKSGHITRAARNKHRRGTQVTVTIASTSFSIPAGQTQLVRAPLTSTGKSLLKRHKRLTVGVLVEQTRAGAPTAAISRQQLTVHRPTRKRHRHH